MTDAALLLRVEAQKKSGWIAALLNLVIPGAGYFYCGRWFLGVIAFFFVIAMLAVSLGYAAIALVLMLVVDGFLCASRYNKVLVLKVLAEDEASNSPPKTALKSGRSGAKIVGAAGALAVLVVLGFAAISFTHRSNSPPQEPMHRPDEIATAPPPVLPQVVPTVPEERKSTEVQSPNPKSALESATPTSAGFAGVWAGLWECGPVLTEGARSPRPFSIPLTLQVGASRVEGERHNSQTTDLFSGEVSHEGKISITGEGHWLDEPARNWASRFEGQIQGDQLSATGAMTTADGKTKIRDCSLAMNTVTETDGASNGGKPR